MKKLLAIGTLLFTLGNTIAVGDDARIKTVSGGAGRISEKAERFEITQDEDSLLTAEEHQTVQKIVETEKKDMHLWDKNLIQTALAI